MGKERWKNESTHDGYTRHYLIQWQGNRQAYTYRTLLIEMLLALGNWITSWGRWSKHCEFMFSDLCKPPDIGNWKDWHQIPIPMCCRKLVSLLQHKRSSNFNFHHIWKIWSVHFAKHIWHLADQLMISHTFRVGQEFSWADVNRAAGCAASALIEHWKYVVRMHFFT